MSRCLPIHLKDEVKKRAQNDLARVDSCHLEVWRLRNPQRLSEIKQSLPNLICLGEVLVEGEDEAACLVPAEEEILPHFSNLPKDKISVLVRVPVPHSQIGGSSDDIFRE